MGWQNMHMSGVSVILGELLEPNVPHSTQLEVDNLNGPKTATMKAKTVREEGWDYASYTLALDTADKYIPPLRPSELWAFNFIFSLVSVKVIILSLVVSVNWITLLLIVVFWNGN